MTNSTKLVAPLWGAERMLGTNPIAIGFPGMEEPPIVIDMATCAAAYGKIEMARRRGEPIPEGWAIDSGAAPRLIRMTWSPAARFCRSVPIAIVAGTKAMV